jgi:hypothetical protein
MKRLPLQPLKLVLGFIALAFCAAPVPGDVGGCAQEAQELDPVAFFWSKQDIDCESCRECGITTDACERACAEVLAQSEFPKDCVPLVHDGEVCLRALLDGSCSDYESYMSDREATTPTECNFCPVRGAP